MIQRIIKPQDLNPVVLAALLILLSSPSFAGTICGTVRDTDTLAPIEKAGVFVRTQDGMYTGFHGATAEAGGFCIDGIPAGTYDLEITVDDYQTRYVRGVVVTDDVTDVDIDIFAIEHFLAAPWPNPSQTGVTFRYTIARPAPVKLEIFDVTGRLVRGWQSRAVEPGEYYLDWDLRDRNSNRVASGVYFVRFTAGDAGRTRVIVTMD
jgi:hypothetical protein